MAKTPKKVGGALIHTEVGQALYRSKRAFFGIGVFSFFINLLMLTGPLYMLQVYDRVLASRSMSTLVAISVLMGAMYAFIGFFEYFRSRVLVRIGNKLEQDLGDRTFAIWLKQGLFGKAGQRHRPLQDLNTLRQFMSGNAPSTFFDVPWIPIYIGVLYYFHWMLGVAGTFGAIIIFIMAWINERTTRKPLQDAQVMRAKGQMFAEASHRNADAITAMGMAGNMQARWHEHVDLASYDTILGSDRAGTSTASTKAFRMFVQSGVLGLGAGLAVYQIVTPGIMIAASIIMGRALAPIQMALGQWRGFIAARSSFERLNKFFEIIPEEEDSMELPEPKGNLSIENIVAAPPGTQTPVLIGLNFALKPGQALAVVGPSASGKSTLARLMVGIWMPQKGSVRLDGACFDQWNRAELGKYIGYLPQDVELFDGTIGENIGRFRPDAAAEDVVLAARRANVHDMILRFPDGYDTRIGEGGHVLSGGQNQRIALARALFGDPALVVLDEPNANLDTDGDMALAAAIKDLRERDKTVVVMTHRPSTLSAVDMLLMLREGKQIAFGPRDEVLKELNKGNEKAPTQANVRPRTAADPQRPKGPAQLPAPGAQQSRPASPGANPAAKPGGGAASASRPRRVGMPSFSAPAASPKPSASQNSPKNKPKTTGENSGGDTS